MEEQKKRRGKNIPEEMVEEILLKLPVKSLVRFRVVSKVWRGTIESTSFIDKHMEYHKSSERGQERVMLLKREIIYDGLALENLLVSDKGIVPVSPYLPIRSFNGFDGFNISGPCDGLICLYTKTRILNLVNPVNRSRRRLPDPTPTMVYGGYSSRSLLGIGRENSVSRRYKLVWLFACDVSNAKESVRCMVFALDSNTWRYVDPPHCGVDYSQPLIHLDGVMYCFSCYLEMLLAFDLHTETFQLSFPITPDIWPEKRPGLGMRVLQSRLCIFKRFVEKDDHIFKIWGLNNNKRSWEIMYSIDLSCFPPEYQNWSIIPIATINNYLIIANHRHEVWVVDGSKSYILYTMPPLNHLEARFEMSYSETLVSAY